MKTRRIIALLLAFVLCIGMVPQGAPAAQAAEVSRDTVLVLDDSGSMGGEPLYALQEAALNFCQTVLQQSGTNRVAVITYSSYAYLQTDFTDSLESLEQAIYNMDASGTTNIYDALELAGWLLEDSDADVKNIVLMSDGLPNEGSWSEYGQYTYYDYDGYDYANAAYALAVSLHPDCYIYTMGFFHGMYGSEREFAVRFMEDLQNAGSYDVEDPEDLIFTFDEIAQEITETAQDGSFRYPSGSRDYSATYYYKDSYFYRDSTEYNPSLATMSLCLALSAFGSSDTDDYALKSQNAQALLGELNFESIQVTDTFREKPTADSVAAIIGRKLVEDDGKPYTLLAVAVRGGGYEQEWASNFTIGNSSMNHEGFQLAANEVLLFISDYIRQENISGDVKLWITGYSRAAATANLAAGMLDSGVSLGDRVALAHEDVFAYTFETPAGTTDPNAGNNAVYGNIFNIINPNDLVTKVAPAAMQFRRYGVDKILPTRENKYNAYSDLQENMLRFYDALESIQKNPDKAYVLNGFVPKRVNPEALDQIIGSLMMPALYWLNGMPEEKLIVDAENTRQSMGAFLDEVISDLIRDHISRSRYANDMEAGVRELCKALFQDESKADAVLESLLDKMGDNWAKLLWKLAWDEYGAYKLVAGYLCDAMKEQGLTGYSTREIKEAAQPLLDAVLAYLTNNLDYLATIVENGSYFGNAHYPELCLAWLQSMDPHYQTDGASSDPGQAFSNGSYRIIRINCPVDVCVYDSSGNLVATIQDEQVRELKESSIMAMVNSDGEKLVYLPSDADFEIQILAREDGTVTYSVNEFSAETGQVERMVSYFEISVSATEELRAIVPAYSDQYITGNMWDGSDTKYSLFNSQGQELMPDLDLAGETVENAFHMVTAQSGNEAWGTTFGSGIRITGSFAQVTAIAKKGCRFDGWYRDGQKVSENAEHRFLVQKDVTLVAKFEKESPQLSYTVAVAAVFALLLTIGGVCAFAIAMPAWQKLEEEKEIPVIPVRLRKEKAPEDQEEKLPRTERGIRKIGTIEIISGPMSGFSVPIRDGETLYLGVDPKTSNLVFSRSYRYVSRQHCAITYKASNHKYYVVDYSSNGTYLAGTTRLEKGKRTPVDAKSVLTLATDACTISLQ